VDDLLKAHGIEFISIGGANSPELRFQAIQTVATYMRRNALDGESAFIACPRQVELSREGREETAFIIDGLEAGSIWDDRLVQGTGRTLRVPKKDGYYDHFMNTLEYAAMAYSPAQPTARDIEKAKRRDDRRAQYDDRDRAPVRRKGYTTRRGR
jgi:hypothetical protein